MEVCYFCRVRRPTWVVDFETRQALVTVDMCEECYKSYQDQEAAVHCLYRSRRFWFKMLLVHCLIWAGSRFALLGRLMARTGFVRRYLDIKPKSPAWFALRLSDALRLR
ncbi:hypothetical protein Desku_0909 [Desulfofundulus kuznetsovii DSM 6115]|uniref:Uncharacterized protein n=1 Tax=Desulfofundulus kuznetsovii (strain DSM 6115 / VKM B-1805 / 17) TaxID=760568 RepID=A0AAU8P992_DESK7|nr:hypothetical protein Desku_0909 [Desulfofundulus kuznetsovii DSM 6115]